MTFFGFSFTILPSYGGSMLIAKSRPARLVFLPGETVCGYIIYANNVMSEVLTSKEDALLEIRKSFFVRELTPAEATTLTAEVIASNLPSSGEIPDNIEESGISDLG
jgi:hypothetical protein